MRRNTTTLFVIIAALLAVNIALRVSPREAVAQQFDFEAARSPHVIQVGDASPSRVYRLWSDDVIEYADFENVNSSCLPADGIAWQEIAETVPLPPGVRITRIYTWRTHPNMLLRLRSDGVVERNLQTSASDGFAWCGWRTPPE